MHINIRKYIHMYVCIYRRELRPFGVTVHAIATGGFNTKFAEIDAVTKDIQIAWERTTPEIRAKYGEKYYKSGL